MCASGVKHVGVTPAGRVPAVIHSLSNAGDAAVEDGVVVLDEADGSVAGLAHVTRPTADSDRRGLCAIATHGRVHVKPPFVERFTQTPLVSSVRLKLICA